MKFKKMLMTAAAFGVAAALTGCVHCAQQNLDGEGKIIEECNVATHNYVTEVDPDSLAIVRPGMLPSKDYFRPMFRSGAKRVQAVGIAKSLEQAREKALKNFLAEHECDFIVAVNFRKEIIRHPQAAFWRWFFRGGINYKVTLCGIPITLESLQREEIEQPAPAKECCNKGKEIAPEQAQAIANVVNVVMEKKMEVINKTIEENKKDLQHLHRPGLLRLKDIDIVVKAKGETPDDTGVVFPAPDCKKIICDQHVDVSCK